MKNLILGIAALLATGLHAADCPNVAGTFLDITKTYAVQITQNKCKSIRYRLRKVDRDGNLVEPAITDIAYVTDGKKHPLYPKNTLFFYIAAFSKTDLKIEPIDVLGVDKCRVYHRTYTIDGNGDLNVKMKYQYESDEVPKEDTVLFKRTVL